ncbi:MAG: uracil-DNA glycosylase [Bacilli bacterium]
MIYDILQNEKNKEYFIDLMEQLDYEYDNYTIYPKRDDLYTAFNLCENVKVVIIGQDPYIKNNQAHGIAFSILNNKITPTLRNIFTELENDLGYKRTNTNLSDWSKQGVLLFNSIFTVRAGESLSHRDIGWEKFSENIVKYIDCHYKNIIYILWGNNARMYKKFIKNGLIIESVHPSPLSCYRGFYNSAPFSKCNKLLRKLGKIEIVW